MIFRTVNYKKYIKLRILATLIDYGIYFLVFFLYVDYFGTKQSDGSTVVNGLPALPLFAFWFLYFPLLEAVNGATPGHDICKLRVVTLTGEKLSFTGALKRRIVDMFEIVPWGIPALICINNTPKFQRIGDLWASAVVVKKTDIIETETKT